MWDYHRGTGFVCHTKDYWVRDFMPVQVYQNVFAKFIFNPDYLQDKKMYITDVDKVINNCPFIKDFIFVNIPLVMDGGNMVFCKGYDGIEETSFVIMTEKVLYENPYYDKDSIEALLKCAFVESDLTIVWIPWDKEDTFGHTDGIVRYIGYNTLGRPRVLVNLELYEDEIANQMYGALAEHFEVIELKLSEYDDLSWAYINCLQTADFIIIPGIGNDVTDAEAIKQYNELFPSYKDHIYMVQMRDFIAEQGGALNCLTWTFNENTIEALLSEKYSDKNMMAKRDKEPVQLTLHQFMMNILNDEANG
ncbi:MAG: agmatine deiminase family protein [Prevotella sp.]|nr:agmatine deiminase family protein [Prevotella sp.]